MNFSYMISYGLSRVHKGIIKKVILDVAGIPAFRLLPANSIPVNIRIRTINDILRKHFEWFC